MDRAYDVLVAFRSVCGGHWLPGRILVHCWIWIDPDGSSLFGECLVKRFQLRPTGILVFLIVESAFIRQRRLSLDSEEILLYCSLWTDCRGECSHLLREHGLSATKKSLIMDDQTVFSTVDFIPELREGEMNFKTSTRNWTNLSCCWAPVCHCWGYKLWPRDG